MSATSWIWTELGIGLTHDVREIRRAYARKLKVTQPEDDADGFQRLRAAYENALAFARHALEAHAPLTSMPEPAAEPEPAAPPEPPPSIERDPELADLGRAVTDLEHALRSREPVSDDELHERLRRVLVSPAMDALTIYHQIESALASLLVATQPASDPLLVECIERFNWNTQSPLRAQESAVLAVLNRCRDLEFLWNVEQGHSTFALEFRQLQHRASRWHRLWRVHVAGGAKAKHLQLIAMLRDHHPALLATLDEDEVEWWMEHGAEPRVSITVLFIGLVMGLIGTMAGASILAPENRRLFGATAGFAFGFGPFAAAQFGKVYLIDRPTRFIFSRIGRFTSPWLTLGWFPIVLGTMLLLAALPLNPVLTWVAVPVGVAACLWAVYMTGPMPPLLMQHQLMVEHSHLIMAVVTNVLVAGWWMASTVELWGAHFDQRLVMTAAAMCAVVFGRRALSTFWYQNLTSRQRYAGMGLLAIVAALVAAWLWVARAQAAVQPTIMALVIGIVLVHRMMRGAWDRDLALLAFLLFIGFTFFLSIALGDVDPPNGPWPLRTIGGLVILSSVVANLVICAYKEYRVVSGHT